LRPPGSRCIGIDRKVKHVSNFISVLIEGRGWCIYNHALGKRFILRGENVVGLLRRNVAGIREVEL